MSFETKLIIAICLPLIAIAFDLFKTIKHFIKRSKANEVSKKLKKKKDDKNIASTETARNIILAAFNIVPIGFSLFLFGKLFMPKPWIESTYPEMNGILANYDEPIEVIFDRPIISENLIINTDPKVELKVEFEKCFPISNLTRKVLIYPKETFWPGENVMIYLSHISNTAHPEVGGEYLLEFTTPPIPEIESLSIEDKLENVPVTQGIVVEYTNKDGPSNSWDVVIEPEEKIEIQTNKNSNNLMINFPEKLKQGTTYKLTIFQTTKTYNPETGEKIKESEKALAKEITFSTVKAPFISEFKPTGSGVLPGDEISIIFDQAMKQDSFAEKIVIEPEILFESEWNENSTVLKLVHGDLTKDTNYKVKILAGVESSVGGILEADYEISFQTVGVVNVIDVNPNHNSTNISTTPTIELYFDQPVDIESAKSKFSLYPASNPSQIVNGTKGGNNTKLSFQPSSSLAFQTKYRIILSKGVKSIYGLDSNTNFVYEFTTKPQITMIDITWDKQDSSYTCNFAASKMALSAKGIYVSETTLIDLAGREEPFNFSTMTGGNPHKGFVYGYGTYWEPISKAVSNYRQNIVKSGWGLAEVCSEIAKGNPIVTWGQNGWSNDAPRNWIATDGTYITGYSGMHSVVIVGCEGDPNNPTYIYIKDPWRKWGDKLTASEMLRRWSYFGNTGMVVY